MNQKEENILKKDLLEKREDLLKLVSRSSSASTNTGIIGDEADFASDSQEKELTFELNDNERVMLDAIEASLRKLESGSFGQCESCKKNISKQRLNAIPFARFCIECQAKNE